MKSSKVIKVFLASPSDVVDERKRADEVVAELNKNLRQSGISIELLKWEEQTPGYGRPQDLINTMLDECDIFVGLLWQHWGSPTGSFTSGFEEEFHRATERRKSQTKPDIWLVFKDVPPNSIKDPGAQLKRVLEFKEKQIKLNEVMFHKVKNVRHWEKDLRGWLIQYVVPVAQSLVPQLESSSISLLATKDLHVATDDDSLNSESLQQISGLLPKFASAVRAGFVEFDSNSSNQLDEIDIVRLYLTTATLLSRRYTRELINVREMNLIHRHRLKIEPARPELSELFRSFIGRAGDQVPGWYWTRNATEDEIVSGLLNLASDDYSEMVRLHALKLLTRAKTAIPHQLWGRLPFKDQDWVVSNAAYDYLAEIGDERALPLFETSDDTHVLSTVDYSKIKLLSRISPAKAVTEFLKRESYVPEEVVARVKETLTSVDQETLQKALASSNDDIRNGALMELSSRELLSSTLAKEFLADSSPSVRATAILALIKYREMPPLNEVEELLKADDNSSGHGLYGSLSKLGGVMGGVNDKKSLNPEKIDLILLEYYKSKDATELRSLVDWFSKEGQFAYEALAIDYFDEFADQIRVDLRTGFERVKQESEDRLAAKYGIENREKAVDQFQNLETFIRSGYAEAALGVILTNGSSSDIDFARKYLTDESFGVRKIAVALLCKHGTVEDVPRLLELATSGWEPWRGDAAKAAIRLSKVPEETAFDLIASKVSEVSDAAFDWFQSYDSLTSEKLFRALLFVDDEKSRNRAVYYLQARAQSPDALLPALLAYENSDTYYYNVVTWLDRLLYAPGSLRDMYLRDLRGEI